MKKNLNGNVAENLKSLILNGYQTVKGKSSNAHSEYNKEFTVDYGDYKIFFNKCYTFWVISVYDNGLRVRMDSLWFPAESQLLDRRFIGDRWSNATVENAVALIIGSIDDYEWEKIVDEGEKITESTKEFENKVEDLGAQIDSYMDETESLMDEVDENGETGWQKNAISENINRIYNILTDIFNEKTSWLADLSKITGCNMTPWDVYSDDYFIDLGHGIELDIFNADITYFFEDLLNTLFERYEDHENQDLASEMLDLRDTLFHYLAVA